MTGAPSAQLGPLRVRPSNPRYFADAAGRTVYLTGAHTWNNLQDRGSGHAFDYLAYLDWLVDLQHNLIRLWAWEHGALVGAGARPITAWAPLCYVVVDGQVDLDVFDPAYFARLRARVAAAAERGLYVAVMLFQGWSGRKWWDNEDPFRGHPYHAQNNRNGLDGRAHTADLVDLDAAAVRTRDAAYIARVVEAVYDLPNVLYEVANEGGSSEWNRFVVQTVRACEVGRPYQHPVGLSAHGDEPTASLLASGADWVAPGCLDLPALYDDPPEVQQGPVRVIDSDHLWGVGGDHRWVWKCFCRGYNLLFMDPYVGSRWGGDDQPAPVLEPARRAMGQTRALADRLNLAASAPASALSSRYYCLAEPGQAYVAYLPEGGFIMLDLSAAPGEFTVEWLHPVDGTVTPDQPIAGGRPRITFWSPLPADAVLVLRRRPTASAAVGPPA